MSADPTSKVSNYGDLTFTPAVLAMQEKMGSRDHYAKIEGVERRITLTAEEEQFIAQRDSFYLSTVGENGWPYVQHRGGPAGFLTVLEPQLLGMPDFKGNRQYLSAGNIQSSNKACLFLMDYPAKARLKIWAEASLSTDPDLVEKVRPREGKFTIERVMLFKVIAFDWNCHLHITPRFTEEQLEASG